MDKINDKAMNAFHELMQSLNSEQEILVASQMLAVLSLKTIHGIGGEDVKNGFLVGAMNDQEPINVTMATKQ